MYSTITKQVTTFRPLIVFSEFKIKVWDKDERGSQTCNEFDKTTHKYLVQTLKLTSNWVKKFEFYEYKHFKLN